MRENIRDIKNPGDRTFVEQDDERRRKDSFIHSLFILYIFIEPVMSQPLTEILYAHLNFPVKTEKDEYCMISLLCGI